MKEVKDKWNDGDPYEYFMGRWSSLMAPVFLKWLNIPSGMNWLDIGCGTGALSESIERNYFPNKISCIDPSPVFIESVKKRISQTNDFRVGNVEDLPYEDLSFNVVVSGLALNFFPNLNRALNEMKRVARPAGVIAAYVWDYSGRMDFLRYFWDAACQIDPKSRDYDEGLRFPICSRDNLSREFHKAGLSEVESSFLDIETTFINFDDYWNPFTGGQGPAPNFLKSLGTKFQDRLKEKILERIDFESDGSIKLTGRAIVIKSINKTKRNNV
jgi:ubiquinone/menaquinone biosynthesis C-methylase UbiE